MILYTRLLFWSAGFTVSQRLIIIHPRYRDDKPLLAHERCHQQQLARAGTLAFWWRYLNCKAFRQASEVEAYRVQIVAGASLDACARHLATKYRLGLNYSAAYQLLKD